LQFKHLYETIVLVENVNARASCKAFPARRRVAAAAFLFGKNGLADEERWRDSARNNFKQ
jgi:hypothetical protein